MPMMFVRTDNVDAADSGPLLSAFISYLLLPSTQAQVGGGRTGCSYCPASQTRHAHACMPRMKLDR